MIPALGTTLNTSTPSTAKKPDSAPAADSVSITIKKEMLGLLYEAIQKAGLDPSTFEMSGGKITEKTAATPAPATPSASAVTAAKNAPQQPDIRQIFNGSFTTASAAPEPAKALSSAPPEDLPGVLIANNRMSPAGGTPANLYQWGALTRPGAYRRMPFTGLSDLSRQVVQNSSRANEFRMYKGVLLEPDEYPVDASGVEVAGWRQQTSQFSA